MAYYMITFKTQLYANVELYKAFYGLSDKDFLRHLAQGKADAEAILGNVCAKITKQVGVRMLEKLSTVIVQDIDKALTELEPAQGGVPLSPCLNSFYKINDTTFVKFNDIELDKKYAKRDKMAVVRVCSALYVAVGHKKKGQDSIVLSASKKGA